MEILLDKFLQELDTTILTIRNLDSQLLNGQHDENLNSQELTEGFKNPLQGLRQVKFVISNRVGLENKYNDHTREFWR